MLLIPLMTKGDVEVQRLAAHAVANLAVNGELAVASPVETILTARCVCAADNRQDIVEEGGIAPLIALMQSVNVEVQRQSTKAIANLAVNGAHITILLHLERGDVRFGREDSASHSCQPQTSLCLVLR
eukprot:COSAG01_NODE_15759_length_1302_cov_5.370740_2_plen_128_part_00